MIEQAVHCRFEAPSQPAADLVPARGKGWSLCAVNAAGRRSVCRTGKLAQGSLGGFNGYLIKAVGCFLSS